MNGLLLTSNTSATWKNKTLLSKLKHRIAHIFPLFILIAAAFNYYVLTNINQNTDNVYVHPKSNEVTFLDKESLNHNLPSMPSRSLANGEEISWLGDNWIPPHGCRIYSIAELSAIFSHFSILWIGDSTIRRTYMTLRAILDQNETTSNLPMEGVDSPHVLDRNKDDPMQEPCHKWKTVEWIHATSLCHSFAPKFQNFDYIRAKCFRDIHYVIQNLTEIQQHQQQQPYNLVVVSGGTWEMSPLKRHECSTGGRKEPFHKENMWNHLNEVLEDLRELQSPQVHVVWRNLPINQHELEKVVWTDTNELVQNNLMSFLNMSQGGNLSYIDMAKALEPRSILYDRIGGNNIYHFGLKARLLFIQILANQLLWNMNQWNHWKPGKKK